MSLREILFFFIGCSIGACAATIIWLSVNNHNTVWIETGKQCVAPASLHFRTTGANNGDTYTIIVNGDTLETNVYSGKEWLIRPLSKTHMVGD